MRLLAAKAGTALLAIIVALSMIASPACGQARVQFPTPNSVAPPMVPVNPGAPAGFGSGGFSGGGFGAPGALPPAPQPGAYLGGTIQPFDPYALPGNMQAPGTFGGPPALSAPPSSIWSGQPPALSVGPTNGAASGLPPGIPRAGAPYGNPTGPIGATQTDPWFRGSPYGSNPAYPDGNRGVAGNPFGSNYDPAYGNNGYGNPANQNNNGPPYQRLFQDTGLRGTYLYGKDKDDLAMTEAEASTTAYFANFLGISNGLRVTPGFAFHWTDGPEAPETSDVPARLYSGYLDFGLNPQFNQVFSAELTARVGIYTDFQSFNEDSIRLLGSAVGIYQASPEIALKIGAAYIDRVKIKLLPAVGILWTPNSQTRWDIFFPAPKLSNYWTTIGNRQVWWYIGGEYGGGSWSIEREENPEVGADERIDINDIRVFAGLEWWSLNRAYGFAEVGYVFDREVVYFHVPGDTLHVDETFMVRAGISW